MIETKSINLEQLAQREQKLGAEIEFASSKIRPVEGQNLAERISIHRRNVLIDYAITNVLTPKLVSVGDLLTDAKAMELASTYEAEKTATEKELEIYRSTGKNVDPLYDTLLTQYEKEMAEFNNRPLTDALLRRGLELQDRDRDREREEQKAENITEQPQNGQKPAREQDEAKTKGKGVKDKKGGKESKTYNVILPDGREIKTTHSRAAALIESLLIRPLTTSEQITAVYGDNPPPFPVQKAGTNRTDAKETLEQAGLTIINPNPSRSGRETAYVIVDKDFKPPVISIDLEGDRFIMNNTELKFNEANIKAVKAVLLELAKRAASDISTQELFAIARDNGYEQNRMGYLIDQLRKLLKDNLQNPQILAIYGGNTSQKASYGLNARVFLTEKKPAVQPVEQTTTSKREAATQDFNRGLITEDEFVDTMRGLDEPDTQIQPEAPAPEALPSAPEQPAAPEPTEAETLQAEIERLTILRDRSMNIRSSGFLTGEKRAKLDETIQRLDEQIRQLNTQLEQPKQPETPEEKQQAEINEILNTMEKAYPEWAHGWNVEDIFSEFGILTPEIIQVVKTWSLIPEWRRRHDRYEIPAGGIEPSKVALIVFLSRHVNEITDPVQTDQIGEAIKQQVALRREQVRQKIAQALDETGTNPVQDSSGEL